MLKRVLTVFAAAVVALSAVPASGQMEALFGQLVRPSESKRGELGRRLKAMERAWLACHDAARREQVIPVIRRAVSRFFFSDPAVVAGLLDDAAAQLSGKERSRARVHADSFDIILRPLLLDSAATTTTLRIVGAYRPESARPAGMKVVVRSGEGARGAVLATVEIDRLPRSVDLGLPAAAEGDYGLTADILDPAGVVIKTMPLPVSRIVQPRARVTALAEHAKETSASLSRVDRATVQWRIDLLSGLANGARYETDYPGARLLKDAERIVAAAGACEGSNSAKGGVAAARERSQDVPGGGVVERGEGDGEMIRQQTSSADGGARTSFAAEKSGDLYLAVPHGSSAWPVRAYKPPKDAPVLVIALHGAGGSENFFFEAYGDGLAAKLCHERGWALLAPRVFTPLDDFWKTVEDLKPVIAPHATRVFVIGHSLGCISALNMAEQHPERLAGVVAISIGGGADEKRFAKVPFFVAAGDHDFGQWGSRDLYQRLRKVGAQAIYRSYATEHMMVVAECLPDAFRWMEKIAK